MTCLQLCEFCVIWGLTWWPCELLIQEQHCHLFYDPKIICNYWLLRTMCLLFTFSLLHYCVKCCCRSPSADLFWVIISFITVWGIEESLTINSEVVCDQPCETGFVIQHSGGCVFRITVTKSDTWIYFLKVFWNVFILKKLLVSWIP